MFRGQKLAAVVSISLGLSLFLLSPAARGSLAGTALSFAGSDVAIVPDNSLFHDIENQDAVTIEAWVCISSFPQGWFSIVDKYNSGSDFGWTFQIQANDNLQFVAGPGPTALVPWSPSLDQPYHVAMSYDRSQGVLDFYVDGALLSSVAYDADIQATDSAAMFLGYNPSGGDEYNDGQIDELRIWNRALSAAEIGSRFNAPLTGTESGLVGYWRFDEGAGETFADASPNGLDGQLLTGPIWAESCALLVPEPATWMLALSGLVGVVAFVGHRRFAAITKHSRPLIV